MKIVEILILIDRVTHIAENISSATNVIISLSRNNITESMSSATKRFQIGGIRYSIPAKSFFHFKLFALLTEISTST